MASHKIDCPDMPWRKAVDLASPIRLAKRVWKTIKLDLHWRAGFTHKAFEFGTAWQTPARSQLRIRNDDRSCHILLRQLQRHPFAISAIPNLTNRTTHPFNTMLKINHQMVTNHEMTRFDDHFICRITGVQILRLRHRRRHTGQHDQDCSHTTAPDDHLEKRKNLHLPHIDLHPLTVAAGKLLYPDLSISCAKSAYLYAEMRIFLFSP